MTAHDRALLRAIAKWRSIPTSELSSADRGIYGALLREAYRRRLTT